MYLNFIFFLLCASVITGEDKSDEGKFIDQLPEKDKQEFLDNIARRILDEVKPIEPQIKSNEAVPEAHLDMQSDFVAKLLKEEQESLMRRRFNETVTDNAVKRNTRSSEDESEKLQTLENEKYSGSHSAINNRDNIDLTLREQTSTTITIATTTVKGETSKTELKKDNLSIEITVNEKITDSKVKPTPEKTQMNENSIPVQIVYDSNHNNFDLTPSKTALDTTETKGENATKYFERHRNDDLDDTRKTAVKERHEKILITEKPDFDLETVKSNLDKNLSDETLQPEDTKNNTVSKEIKVHEKLSDDSKKSTSDESKENQKPSVMENDLPNNFQTVTEILGDYTQAASYKDTTTENIIKIEKLTAGGISVNPVNKNKLDTPTLSLKDDLSNGTQVEKLNDNTDGNFNKDIDVNSSEDNYVTHNNVNPTEKTHDLSYTIKANTEPVEVEHTTETSKEYTESNTEPDENSFERNSSKIGLRSDKITNGYVLTTEQTNLTLEQTKELISTPKIQQKRRNKFSRMKLINKMNQQNKTKQMLEQEVVIGENVKVEFDSKIFYEMQKKYKKNETYKVYEISPGQSPFLAKNSKLNKNTRDRTDDKIQIADTPYQIPVNYYTPNNANFKSTHILENNFKDADTDVNNNYSKDKFLRTEQKIEDNPYYVPVHDFAPNNAYFNPNNRLGPDFEEVEGNIANEYVENNILRTENKREETSYYVPVHDYAPNNAYFDPSNRLGPNVGDLASEIIEDRKTLTEEREDSSDDFDIDSYETGRKKLFNFKGFNNNQKHKPKPQKVSVIKHNAKPSTLFDDDITFDYYFGRKEYPRNYKTINGRKRHHKRKEHFVLPISAENNNPYYAISNNQLRNHVHTIRQIMLNNRLFGVVPERTTTRKPSKHKVQTGIKLHPKTKNSGNLLRSQYGNVVFVSPIKPKKYESDQELDYHFGGIVDSREVIAKHKSKKRERWNKHKAKPTLRCIGSDGYCLALTGSKEKNETENKNENENENENEDENENENKNQNNTQNEKEQSKKKNKVTIDDLKLIANISDAKDVVKVILEMQSMLRSTGTDNTLDAYLTVMEDLIKLDNRGLYQYDWLRTAVDIQAALNKLLHLIKDMQNGGTKVYPSDLQLLSYVVYLYETSEASLHKFRLSNALNNLGANGLLDKLAQIPKQEKHVKYSEPESLELKDIIKRNRAIRFNMVRGRRQMDDVIPVEQMEIPPLPSFDPIKNTLTSSKGDGFEDKLRKLKTFLNEVQYSVNDLHDAIKNVAMVSKYNTHLYKNLKELYLRKPSRKQVAEVLLHIFGTRLVGLVEESVVNGLTKKDYEEYIEENEDKVKRTTAEFVVVLKLLDTLKKL